MDDGTNKATGNGDGRRSDGTFKPGHKFARGNPVHRRMAGLRAVLVGSVTPDQIRAATAKLGELAAGGDVPACKLLLEYAIGRPVQAIELSGPDGEPLGLGVDQLQATILGALEPFGPEARLAVAMAIQGMIANAAGRP